ncbi:diaminopimelate decarboxylase [Rhizosaccharibacter radicis]|uniref:Diaminopimelate decarboxylase n=1 Tax=Rhizosaccharibacter radicis TaxID=2782605 RepID=A0ABT1VYF0_9PROT|nr:diaminopimelate decarboxylase [Acetobacteraceae bacterium KSS12]
MPTIITDSAAEDAVPTHDPSVAELIAARPSLRMHALDGLMFEGVRLDAIAQDLGTPCWVMGAGTVRARLRRLREAAAEAALPLGIHYAVKANDHLAVLSLLRAEGVGADVVSGGELARSTAVGFDPRQVVFSGVGKTPDELRAALGAGIGQINVESAEELDQLSALATTMGRAARVALRINPDVDAGTHAKITTGLADNKFGIAYADAPALFRRAASLPGIEPVGFAVHIGSQITEASPFRSAYRRMADLVRSVRADGLPVSVLDCGGGLGISYRDGPEGSPRTWFAAIRQELGDLDLRLMIEPGRWLVGPAGLLLASVLLVKRTAGAPFLVLDAAMNDLLRPSLYEAWHGIVPLSPRAALASRQPTNIVGPVCETGDSFATDRLLPPLAPGMRVAILDAGAYGAVMSSTYNARPLAAQAMLDGERWQTIRERQPVPALWAGETVPSWCAAP